MASVNIAQPLGSLNYDGRHGKISHILLSTAVTDHHFGKFWQVKFWQVIDTGRFKEGSILSNGNMDRVSQYGIRQSAEMGHFGSDRIAHGQLQQCGCTWGSEFA